MATTKRPPRAAAQSRPRYCEIRANNLEEILATCNRHIENICRTQLDLLEEGDGTPTDDFYCNMFRAAWQDMRDDVSAILEAQKTNKPTMPPAGWALTGLMPAVYVVEYTEHEFGQRPCGYGAFLTELSAKEYIREAEAEDGRHLAAPGQYFTYDYIGIRECSHPFYKRLIGTGAESLARLAFDKLAELKGP